MSKSAISAAEVLDAAADYIQTYGLSKGLVGADGGPRCIMGAIRSVINYEGGWGYIHARSTPRRIRDAIVVEFRNTYGMAPSVYNDSFAATKESVMDAMRNVACRLRGY